MSAVFVLVTLEDPGLLLVLLVDSIVTVTCVIFNAPQKKLHAYLADFSHFWCFPTTHNKRLNGMFLKKTRSMVRINKR